MDVEKTVNCFASADEAYRHLCTDVMRNGHYVSTRGSETRERVGVSFVLTNPRARVITSVQRKWSLPLALGELCWHLRGDDRVEPLAYYAKRWMRYSDDGVHISGSCYGKKIFSAVDGCKNEWQSIVTLLRADTNSRRAVIGLGSEGIDLLQSRDVSCVNSIQFLVRNGQLDLFTFMRSNDVFIGLPYDLFLFTMLQEMMALTLNVRLGQYHHIATSMHIYDADFERVDAFSKLVDDDGATMPPMSSVTGATQFVVAEAEIRERGYYAGPPLESFWNELADRLMAHALAGEHGYEAIRAAG